MFCHRLWFGVRCSFAKTIYEKQLRWVKPTGVVASMGSILWETEYPLKVARLHSGWAANWGQDSALGQCTRATWMTACHPTESPPHLFFMWQTDVRLADNFQFSPRFIPPSTMKRAPHSTKMAVWWISPLISPWQRHTPKRRNSRWSSGDAGDDLSSIFINGLPSLAITKIGTIMTWAQQKQMPGQALGALAASEIVRNATKFRQRQEILAGK